MLAKSVLKIYIFTLVWALVGIGQCKWLNIIIRTWSTFVSHFHSWCHVIWNKTSFSEPFKALLHNFLFQLCWWNNYVCGPKIVFFITPINHIDVKTGIKNLKIWVIASVNLWVEINPPCLYMIMNWNDIDCLHLHNIRNRYVCLTILSMVVPAQFLILQLSLVDLLTNKSINIEVISIPDNKVMKHCFYDGKK